MELKTICMFKIRPSVGADTTVLSKCPHLPPHQHPSPSHLHALEILRQWEDGSFTNKEVIPNFLQLLSSLQGATRKGNEKRPYQVGTKIATAVPWSEVAAAPGLPPSGPLIVIFTPSLANPRPARPLQGQPGHHQHGLSRDPGWLAGVRGLGLTPTAWESPEDRTPAQPRGLRSVPVSQTAATSHLYTFARTTSSFHDYSTIFFCRTPFYSISVNLVTTALQRTSVYL